MASPGDNKGQHRGTCGHIIAAFDAHEKCAHSRDKNIGQEACVLYEPCASCDELSELQKETLSTPSYRI